MRKRQRKKKRKIKKRKRKKKNQQNGKNTENSLAIGPAVRSPKSASWALWTKTCTSWGLIKGFGEFHHSDAL